MKAQFLVPLISLAALAATPLASNAQDVTTTSQAANTSAQTMFRCDISQKTPSTIMTGMVSAENPQPIPLLNWSAEHFNSEQQALKLCQQVSEQLQTFYEQGKLVDLSLVSGEVDGEAVVCLQGESTSGCSPELVLFTLETEKSPNAVLYDLIASEWQPTTTRGDFPTRLDFSFLGFL